MQLSFSWMPPRVPYVATVAFENESLRAAGRGAFQSERDTCCRITVYCMHAWVQRWWSAWAITVAHKSSRRRARACQRKTHSPPGWRSPAVCEYRTGPYGGEWGWRGCTHESPLYGLTVPSARRGAASAGCAARARTSCQHTIRGWYCAVVPYGTVHIRARTVMNSGGVCGSSATQDSRAPSAARPFGRRGECGVSCKRLLRGFTRRFTHAPRRNAPKLVYDAVGGRCARELLHCRRRVAMPSMERERG